MKIKTILPDGRTYENDYEQGIRVIDIFNSLGVSLEYKVLLSRFNNMYRDLNHRLIHNGVLELMDMRENYAWLTYQNSLVLLYKKAVADVLGNVVVEIDNSLNQGLFTTIKYAINEEIVKKIENRMREIVALKTPIVKERVTKEEILNISKNSTAKNKFQFLEAIEHIKDVEIYSLDAHKELFYGFLVPDTSFLDLFELRKYRHGILLRYPHLSNPNKLPEFEDQKKMYDAFAESAKWGQLMGVNYVADLNNKIRKNEYKDLIMLQEALHEKRISDIADEIKAKEKHVILIAGPSSSGKTSFAKRLCIQLKVIGLKPLYLGTDDYFEERENCVVDEKGEKDFENVLAIDISLFNKQINALLKGEKVDIPRFNFISGKKEYGHRITSITKNQPIVIEGTHALNEILTNEIEEKEKFKIYISPLTSLNINDHNRIPTTDARMLRRLIRDYATRGMSASKTIESWPKVRKGEEKYIFPYVGKADIFFNTNYIYELSVLKKYAYPLLASIKRDEKVYAEAQRMMSFLRYFNEIDEDSLISNNSILREFIGGSILL